MAAHSPQDRRTNARLGGLRRAAMNDTGALMQAPHAAAPSSPTYFYDEVDPRRELPEAERVRRAEAAQSAYFVRLGKRSAQARRARRGRSDT